MSILQDVLDALVKLETTGSASIGPEVNTNTVSIFGQEIDVEESVSVTLKKH